MSTCENKVINMWCNNEDVRTVQRKSRSPGPAGKNIYKGEILEMCSECRKSNTGQVKFVR